MSKRIKIESLQSTVGADSISPGAFAMLMGVHVRFRLETDPMFTDPKFLTEPLNGPCKPESLMIIELECLLNASEIAKYNSSLLQCMKDRIETKQQPFDLMANRWTSLPTQYSIDVKNRYERTLIEYEKCSEILNNKSKDNYNHRLYLKETQNYLDLYPFLAPGLFLTMLGIHARFPETEEQAKHVNTQVFTGECRSVSLMVSELMLIFDSLDGVDLSFEDILHDREYDDIFDFIEDEISEENPNAILIPESIENTMYLVRVAKFLNRIRYEYRECRERRDHIDSLVSSTDPRLQGKLFMCSKYHNTNPFDPSVTPANIRRLCDEQLCEDQDPVSYEVLDESPVKILVGGKPVCYNFSTIDQTLKKSIKEPTTNIPFSEEHLLKYFHKSREEYFRILQRTETSQDFHNRILFGMRDMIRNYAAKYGLTVNTIDVFLPGKYMDKRLSVQPRDYIRRKAMDLDHILKTLYIRLWRAPVSSEYDSQSKALIDAYMNREASDHTLGDPRQHGYIPQPGDHDYNPVESSIVLHPWNPDVDRIPTDEWDIVTEIRYRHTLDHDSLVNRILELFVEGFRDHIIGTDFNFTPEDYSKLHDLLEYFTSHDGDERLKNQTAKNVFYSALIPETSYSAHTRNMLNGPLLDQVISFIKNENH